MRSPSTATAWAVGWLLSTVQILALRMMRSAAGFDCACKNSDELAHINIDKATVKKALVRRRVVFIRLWSSVEGSSSEFELPNLCDRLRYRIIQLVESDPTRGYRATLGTEPQPRGSRSF